MNFGRLLSYRRLERSGYGVLAVALLLLFAAPREMRPTWLLLLLNGIGVAALAGAGAFFERDA